MPQSADRAGRDHDRDDRRRAAASFTASSRPVDQVEVVLLVALGLPDVEPAPGEAATGTSTTPSSSQGNGRPRRGVAARRGRRRAAAAVRPAGSRRPPPAAARAESWARTSVRSSRTRRARRACASAAGRRPPRVRGRAPSAARVCGWRRPCAAAVGHGGDTVRAPRTSRSRSSRPWRRLTGSSCLSAPVMRDGVVAAVRGCSSSMWAEADQEERWTRTKPAGCPAAPRAPRAASGPGGCRSRVQSCVVAGRLDVADVGALDEPDLPPSSTGIVSSATSPWLCRPGPRRRPGGPPRQPLRPYRLDDVVERLQVERRPPRARRRRSRRPAGAAAANWPRTLARSSPVSRGMRMSRKTASTASSSRTRNASAASDGGQHDVHPRVARAAGRRARRSAGASSSTASTRSPVVVIRRAPPPRTSAPVRSPACPRPGPVSTTSP